MIGKNELKQAKDFVLSVLSEKALPHQRQVPLGLLDLSVWVIFWGQRHTEHHEVQHHLYLPSQTWALGAEHHTSYGGIYCARQSAYHACERCWCPYGNTVSGYQTWWSVSTDVKKRVFIVWRPSLPHNHGVYIYSQSSEKSYDLAMIWYFGFPLTDLRRIAYAGVNEWRPFWRRRLRTFRPFAETDLLRKPWVRRRLRFLSLASIRVNFTNENTQIIWKKIISQLVFFAAAENKNE